MPKRELHFDGYVLDVDEKGRTVVRREYRDLNAPGDYGADPLGDGTFRMVPSGDIVDYDERCRRLARARSGTCPKEER